MAINSDLNNIIHQAQFEADKNWIKASVILQKAIEEFPSEKKLYNELGNLYFKKGIFDKAIEVYEQGIRIDDSDSDLIYKTAYCLLLDGEFEKSIEYFDMIGEKIPEAIYNKAIALYKMNRGYKAIETLEELIKDNQHSNRPYILLGKIYLEYERYRNALAMCNQALGLFGNCKDLYYIRGVANFHLKKWMPAYLDFELSEKDSAESPVFYRIYAMVCEKIGMTDKAISLLKTCIKQFPKSDGAYFDMIRILIIHNRHQEALDLSRKTKGKGDNDLLRNIFDSLDDDEQTD